jgi:membrane protein implicated in regulation of membrane protease activity
MGIPMLAAEFGTGQVFLSMLLFFLFFILIWLVLAIFADIFRSSDLSGWAKALWVLFVIVLPFLGVFTYLIVRGSKMRDYATAGTNRRDQVYRTYVGDLTPGP